MKFFNPASWTAGAALFCLGLPALSPAQARVDVLTYHNDNFRSGQNLSESRLTPETVNATTFGKLFTVPVDGKVDAQPLYVSSLPVGAPSAWSALFRDVVFAATEHDSVYAFDAANGAIYWQKSLLFPGETTSDPLSCTQVIPEIGITATPVIDRSIGPNGTIYVVAMSKDAAGNYHQRIHALDLVTGAEELGGPVEIQASYPGTGQEINSGNTVIFNPRQHEDRAALLLSGGIVYTSWSSHCDHKPYTGWVIGYDAQTLAQTSVFNLNPNGSEASIWNSGAGPAVDAQGNLFFSVANGVFDTTLTAEGFPSAGDYGNTVLKLTPQQNAPIIQALLPTDYWTMFNTVDESNRDVDLGSGGILLLPDLPDANGTLRQLAVVSGKDQSIYVVDRNNMGKFNPADNSNVYQELHNALAGREYGAITWFNGRVYIGAVNDAVRAYDVNNARLSASPSSSSTNTFPFPGTNPVISANGISGGILWAFDNGASAAGGAMPDVPAVLHAYDPANLNTEYYNTSQAPNGRDNFGIGNKFISPTVANGYVYVGTINSVAAFGLLR
jgi:hypothetical protein